MKVAKTIEQVRAAVREAKADGKRVGLVPTMGALHEAHLSLIDAAKARCDFVVVSIFVNPTQFAPTEDLATYPRPLEADLAACRRRGVAMAFTPDVETMYPGDRVTEVTVGRLGEVLCGRSRPTHFAGVCTVVAKLFNIVCPHAAFFGAKDFQQAVILRRMAADLNFPLEVVVCPTIRDGEGLALSSRNAYLSEAQRKQAAALHEALEMAAERIAAARPPAKQIAAEIRRHLGAHAPDGEIDYVEIVDPFSLANVERTDDSILIALAVRFGRTRLIDNILVDARTSGR